MELKHLASLALKKWKDPKSFLTGNCAFCDDSQQNKMTDVTNCGNCICPEWLCGYNCYGIIDYLCDISANVHIVEDVKDTEVYGIMILALEGLVKEESIKHLKKVFNYIS